MTTKISAIITMILLIGAITTGMSLWYGSLFNYYGVSADNLSTISHSKEVASALETNGTAALQDTGLLGDFAYVLSAGVKAIVVIFTFPGIIIGMLADVTNVLSPAIALSPWFIELVAAMVWVIFIFGVLSLYFGRDA